MSSFSHNTAVAPRTHSCCGAVNISLLMRKGLWSPTHPWRVIGCWRRRSHFLQWSGSCSSSEYHVHARSPNPKNKDMEVGGGLVGKKKGFSGNEKGLREGWNFHLGWTWPNNTLYTCMKTLNNKKVQNHLIFSKYKSALQWDAITQY